MYNLLLHHKSSIALPHIYCKQLVVAKESYFGHLCVLSIQEQDFAAVILQVGESSQFGACLFSVLTRALWPEDYFNIFHNENKSVLLHVM
jgi:hypothetical protein